MNHVYGDIIDDATTAEAYAMAMPAFPSEARGHTLATVTHALAVIAAATACAICVTLGERAAMPAASLAMLLSTTGMWLTGRNPAPAWQRRSPSIDAIASAVASFGVAPAMIAAWSAWTALSAWGIATYPSVIIGLGWVCAVAYRMAWHEVAWASHLRRPMTRLSRVAAMPVVAVTVPAVGIACSLLGMPQAFGGTISLLEGIWALLLSSTSFQTRHGMPRAESAVLAASAGFLLSVAFALM